jgi:hypothetical protein
MSGLNGAITFAKAHPVPVGLGVFVGGLILWMMLRGGGGDSQAADPAASAYYDAQARQAASDDALSIAQINANAAVALGLSGNETGLLRETIWSDVSKQTVASNERTAIALAPYQLQGQIVGAIGDLADAPVLTNTTSKGSSGFSLAGTYEGVGGKIGYTKGGKSTQTQTANPAVLAALAQLQQLSTTYSPMH